MGVFASDGAIFGGDVDMDGFILFAWMRVCWIFVSSLRKDWAAAGELNVTCIHWGGLRVVLVLCWIRWTSIMFSLDILEVNLTKWS